MKLWRKSEQDTLRDIMSTDVFVKVFSQDRLQAEMDSDVQRAFEMFRNFERQMSRFISGSELSQLNCLEKMIVSDELFAILVRCKEYHRETRGIFDPSILTQLKREGYGGSFLSDRFGKGEEVGMNIYTFFDVQLESKTRCVQKPLELMVDLGGIGKGYIVDKVIEMLGKKYRDVFVCAGGDIRAIGSDRENGYDFWASDVENAGKENEATEILLLRDCAVATSGTNRRKWEINGQKKHHLIDPYLGRSAETDVVSVTVVAKTAEEADVWAKTLCILGLHAGMRRAQEKKLAALFIDTSGEVFQSQEFGQYRWAEKKEC